MQQWTANERDKWKKKTTAHILLSRRSKLMKFSLLIAGLRRKSSTHSAPTPVSSLSLSQTLAWCFPVREASASFTGCCGFCSCFFIWESWFSVSFFSCFNSCACLEILVSNHTCLQITHHGLPIASKEGEEGEGGEWEENHKPSQLSLYRFTIM